MANKPGCAPLDRALGTRPSRADRHACAPLQRVRNCAGPSTRRAGATEVDPPPARRACKRRRAFCATFGRSDLGLALHPPYCARMRSVYCRTTQPPSSRSDSPVWRQTNRRQDRRHTISARRSGPSGVGAAVSVYRVSNPPTPEIAAPRGPDLLTPYQRQRLRKMPLEPLSRGPCPARITEGCSSRLRSGPGMPQQSRHVRVISL